MHHTTGSLKLTIFISLDEFIECPDNWAANRQTRMLADLKRVGCYDLSLMPIEKREQIMLESAKENLLKVKAILDKNRLMMRIFAL